MAIRRLALFVGAAGLMVVAACASIVGLDVSDPAATSSNDGGGTTSSTSSSGSAAVDGGLTTEAGVSLSASSVNFQRAGCGTQQTQTIFVKNDGDTPASVDVSLQDVTVFTLADSANGAVHLDVAAHGQGAFTVQAQSSVAGSNAADVLVKIGDEEHHVSVALETAGGALTFDPPQIGFGLVKINTTSEKQKIVLRNDGNDAILVKSFTNTLNFQVLDLPADLAPGAVVEKDVQMGPGGAGPEQTDMLKAEVDGLCGEAPILTLKGQRIDAEYTVNPSTVEFGDVNCGAAGSGTKTVTISNYTNTERPFTYSLGKTPSPFKATATTTKVSATANPAQPTTATIAISLLSAGQTPGDVTDTLTVTVSDMPVTVNLHALARGALFTLDRSTLSLARSSQSSGRGTVKLTNAGNVNACVQYKRTNDTFLSEDYSCYDCGYHCVSCSVSDDTDQVNAKTTTDWSIRYYSGYSTTSITANLVRCSGSSSTAPLCGTLPKVTVSPSN